jgi:adenylate cyclase
MVVEIVSALSRFPSLFVIASGTSFNLRGDTRSSGAIARELGVRYILQGSVRKSGAAIRIAVELLDGDGHTPIWTQRFDGTLNDVFALQDEVAGAVAARIDSSIQAHEMRQANTRLTNDQGAYDLFLRGSHNMWATYEEAELRAAISLFDQAIERDPEFALAMALCSNACFNLVQCSPGADSEAMMAKCLTLAQRALATDRDDYRVLAWVSYSFLQCGQPIDKATALIEQAREMNPGDSVALYNSGWVSVFTPNPNRALAEFEAASKLDPRSPWRTPCLGGRGMALLLLDRFEEAVPLLREMADGVPVVRSCFNTMQAAALGFLGKTVEARALDSVCSPLSARDQAFIDRVRDGSLKPKVLEGLRLAGIGVG